MAKTTAFHPNYSKLARTALGARQLGELYYYTGKPCRAGHTGLRYASSGNCVECIEQKRGIVFAKARGRVSDENAKRAHDAALSGFLTYAPAEPCKNGHFQRYVSSHNCVVCNNVQHEKRKERAKWLRIKSLYGLTPQSFNAMLEKQRSKCAICETELTNKNTHIDHCHNAGHVRGLLCSRCNQAIGLLDENIDRLKKAEKYLLETVSAARLSEKGD